MPKKLGKKIKLWRTEMSIRTRRRKAEKNRKEKEKKGKGKNKITKDVNIEMSKEKSELFEVIEDVDDPRHFHFKKDGTVVQEKFNSTFSAHHDVKDVKNDKHILIVAAPR